MVAARIADVRARATARNGGRLNARLRGRDLRAALPPRSRARRRASGRPGEAEAASGRGTERLLRVARTIADLAGVPDVAADHLDEASWFGSPAAARAATPWPPDARRRRGPGPTPDADDGSDRVGVRRAR